MFEIFLGIIQLVFISVICLREVKHKSPAALMWATLLLMFGLSHFVTCVANRTSYSRDTINETSFFVIFFCTIYIIIRESLWHKPPMKKMKEDFNYKNLVGFNEYSSVGSSSQIMISVFYAIIVFQILTLIIAVGGIDNISWGSIYARSQSLSYFNTKTIFHLLYFSLGGVVCCQLVDRKKIGFLISAGLIFIYTVIGGGSRIIILPLIVSVISYFLFKIKKIKLRTIIIAGVLGIVVIYLVYGVLILRHYGNVLDAIKELSLEDITERIVTYIQNGKGELGLKNVFYHFMEHNGNFTDFGKGHTYIRMLLVYLPTKLAFGLKPDDFAITMGAAMKMGPGGSTHPTLFGDCYANFFWFGILMGAFWALYAYVTDRIVVSFRKRNIKILAYVLMGYTYVVVGRGSVYNGFFDVAWGLLILRLIELILLRMPQCVFPFGKRIKIRFGSGMYRRELNGEKRNC